MPIGSAEHPFYGTINGNGHTITGLTNGSLTSTADAFSTFTTKSYGSAYGFIGLAGAPVEGKNLVVKDLNFEDVNIKMDMFGNCVGALLGYAMDQSHFAEFQGNTNTGLAKVEINNVKVLSGIVSGNNNVAGLIGKSYSHETEMKNCSNAAEVKAKYNSNSSRAAGLISFTISPKITMSGNTNSGTVSAGTYLAGLISLNYSGGYNVACDFEILNNTNSGKLIYTGTSASNNMAYIVNVSSKGWTEALAGSKYNFGNDTTKNVNTAPAVEMPNAGGTKTPVLVQTAINSTVEANGTSASK